MRWWKHDSATMTVSSPSTMLSESILVIVATLCPGAVRYIGIPYNWMMTGEHDAGR